MGYKAPPPGASLSRRKSIRTDVQFRCIRMSSGRPQTRSSSTEQSNFASGANISDLSLVRCAQSGETQAFDRLVLRYRPRVVELAMRYTRNRADAEDAAQEAFIRAYGGLRHFRCESTFYTWLYRIASNCARSLLKARARDLPSSTIDAADGDTAGRHQTRLQEVATPEELTSTDDIRGVVNAALESLSDEFRAAITLREIDGLTYNDIASAMSIPVGTVRSRVFRARDIIDHQLRRVYDAGLGRHTAKKSTAA
jgi:RNA polymerase sigma-70 factor (ECF subfamily)